MTDAPTPGPHPPLPSARAGESPPPTLLCFDFDGTLVDHLTDPPFCRDLGALLRTLKARGGAWAINTGRSLSHTLEGIRQHRVCATPDFIVAREHEIYARTSHDRWTALGTWNEVSQRRHREFFRQHRAFLHSIRDFVEAESRACWIEDQDDPAGLIAATETTMEEIVAYVEEHRVRFPEFGYQRNSIYMRFTHCDYHKGAALRHLAAELGLSASAIFAAGDNHNDLSMLRREIAATVCCPANAVPEVKEQVRREGGIITRADATRGMTEALRQILQ